MEKHAIKALRPNSNKDVREEKVKGMPRGCHNQEHISSTNTMDIGWLCNINDRFYVCPCALCTAKNLRTRTNYRIGKEFRQRYQEYERIVQMAMV